MKVTALSAQIRNPDRVNVSVDGSYLFSLTLDQILDLGIKVGREYDDSEIEMFKAEGQFGKLYSRTLEYVMLRPRSTREVRDYLYRKTRARPFKNHHTGDVRIVEGMPTSLTERVLEVLLKKGYVDDVAFAEFWVRHRHTTKGVSQRRLRAELQVKGVVSSIIDEALRSSERSDGEELLKVLRKKRGRYEDDVKLMQYLARQGFSYDAIKTALADEREQD